MPVVKKLTQEEINSLSLYKVKAATGVRERARQQYDEFVAPFVDGDVAEVRLFLEDKKSIVVARIKAAARRKGLVATVSGRSSDDVVYIRFKEVQVVQVLESLRIEDLPDIESKPVNRTIAVTTKVARKRAKK